jgi:O-antigen ligase
VDSGSRGPSPRERRALAWLAAGTFCAIVLANTLPAFPVAVVAALAAGGLLTAAALVVRVRVSRTALLVLAFLGWSVLSGLVGGGLRPADLLDMDFWRNDGRLFVAYVPLVLLGFHAPSLETLRLALRFMALVAAVSFTHFLVFLALGGPGPRFEGFFTHHIGAGGFFGLFATAMVVVGAETGRRRYRWLGYAVFLLMLVAGSRAALLAGAGTLGLWMVVNPLGRRSARTLLPAVAALVLTLPWLAPDAVGRFTEYPLRELPLQMVQGAEDISWQDPAEDRIYGGPYWNAVWRVVFWRRGVELFARSPLVGVGFGRYNDSDFDTVGLEGLAAPASGGYVISSPLSAHNTVLHLLAETGLVGLVLFGLIWGRILLRTRPRPGDPDLLRGAKEATRYCILYVTLTSVFGHVFAAPSLMLFLGALAGITTEVDPSPGDPRGASSTAGTPEAGAVEAPPPLLLGPRGWPGSPPGAPAEGPRGPVR